MSPVSSSTPAAGAASAPRAPRGTVSVLGAGFAGLIAARELERLGFEVQVFEARDRIGGRTWTDERMGQSLEMGGTWVHWMQPYVWGECVRYGAEIYPSPICEEAYWIAGDTVYSGCEADVDRLIEPIQDHIFAGSRELFPYPHAPWTKAGDLAPLDVGVVMDSVTGPDSPFTAEQIALADSYWSAGYNGPTPTASPLMAKHWASLSDHKLSLMDDQTLRYKLVDGMKGIYDQIAADIRGPIYLNSPATTVTEDAQGVTVTLEDGTKVTSDYLVTTIPVGALKHVEFTHGLPAHIDRVVAEGWNCRGLKIWVQAKGHRNVIAYAPTGHPITLMRTEKFLDDGTMMLVGFGPNHDAIDMDNVEEVQKALDAWGADLEVVASCGHDWTADRYSGQTWTSPKTGQFLDAHPEHLLNGRIAFAGSDWAAGWNSFVDGAIETGFRSAREIATAAG
ncbi:amine oxidase [Corynebacterium sp. 13CS0277]|uniref:flavin monoamine oxidase family protein n=1 Tax=Corynebacterium sp. 13CS0277 TaxID=2071994 RepID=UPI000D026E91|nr:NAD(P)/FAD-dependent oxidoreductase [Corynebacterium sp. 13CS0277]PRQ10881.1 amine oxidase [Corynebacterium sp. 13CS0277]